MVGEVTSPEYLYYPKMREDADHMGFSCTRRLLRKSELESAVYQMLLNNIFKLYDRISSKVVSPTRAPPSDAVLKCRDALDALRDFEQSLSPGELELETSGEIEELKELLTQPHFRLICSYPEYDHKNHQSSLLPSPQQKGPNFSPKVIALVNNSDIIWDSIPQSTCGNSERFIL
ncbi:hypothetical protein J6590_066652 [Homalodisca vitripennis]|nr:hypothetical protein J6590_066652 [Homalodisca vitripennis]